MELIERSGFLTELEEIFSKVKDGEGHCVFISGEAGIGKTSLLKAFCKQTGNDNHLYLGTCDALSTPRPMSPLFDILLHLGCEIPEYSSEITNRTEFFSKIFYELSIKKEPIVVLFEDTHWADDATLDFIKFLARRITQLRCLFVITFRDNIIHTLHTLRNIMGQLDPDSFTRMPLPPLSRQAVEEMAEKKGCDGNAIYNLSGGNPFYVNEILANTNHGIPVNIKNSILSVYNRQSVKTRHVWELLSVLPTGLNIKYLEKIKPSFVEAMETSLALGVLTLKDGHIFFKHELYTRTIESALSPLLRKKLNNKILELFLENFEQTQEFERIVHHAINAKANDLVVKYAPLAAKQAASVGDHLKASKLYFSAIEYYHQDNENGCLANLYEMYAYECYLTGQIKEAINFGEKALTIWTEKKDNDKAANSFRFLSMLCCFESNHNKAAYYGLQAIEALENQPVSKVKVMACSNMSYVKMVAGHPAESMSWGKKAIKMARILGDDEVLSHALLNVGAMLIKTTSFRSKGIRILKESLDIALKNSYHEQVAWAYTHIGSTAVCMKDYATAKTNLNAGILYCEKNGLNTWTNYMQSFMARLHLESGQWDEACSIADNLLEIDNLVHVVKTNALLVLGTVKMRKGDATALPFLLEAEAIAAKTMQAQNVFPVLIALLQYEYLTGNNIIQNSSLNQAIKMVGHTENIYESSQFAFWLLKAREQKIPLRVYYEGYQVNNEVAVQKAATLWEQLGCPYEQAIVLFNGNEADKRKAMSIMHGLDAPAMYDKMKQEMRHLGIKNIPRGIRKTFHSNAANLTKRELDVLQLLREGMQNKEIAARLFISHKTVDHHISAILFKLDVHSRQKAVQAAIQRSIIK